MIPDVPVASIISHNQSSLGFLQLHPPSVWNCSTLQDDSRKVSVEADDKQQSWELCLGSEILSYFDSSVSHDDDTDYSISS